MTQRFYLGPAVSADAEVPAADAPALRTYTKAQFRDDGALTRTEVYDGGRPIEVNYYDPEDEDRTVASHARFRALARRSTSSRHMNAYSSTSSEI